MDNAQRTGSIIKARYRILGILGRGGSGITYKAEDSFTSRHVAVKELSLKGLSNWKKLELFEREAKVLASLNHPAIPDYIDYFQIDVEDNRFFYIVQELAKGRSLEDWSATGKRFSEAEIRRIAIEILQALQYLHELNPPIIHRDIKPQNIILGKDDRIFLVDFGAVQTVYRNTMAFGSTVVGSYGYMAPEQFRGQAFPNTDLYGLGTTLLNLLSHQNPGDLPQHRLKIDFRPYIKVSDEFADWLEGLLEPLAEDRFDSVATALVDLTNHSPDQAPYSAPSPSLPQLLERVGGSRVHLNRSRKHLSLKIPPAGLRREETLKIAQSNISWNVFLLLFTFGLAWFPTISLMFFPVLLLLPFFWVVGVNMSGVLLYALLGSTSLEIGRNRFTLVRQILFLKRISTGRTEDIEEVELSQFYNFNLHHFEAITLQAGAKKIKFGMTLSTLEKEWLLSEIETFIQEQEGC
ncbi:MAG: serine/threonine-protein kinase [Leptolyngbyaceae cyanobacterium MO_188.B28]|nr:serine/threonine-protein kinase [Leptolyngbyaceae cyanobacterium MO_188.B28]